MKLIYLLYHDNILLRASDMYKKKRNKRDIKGETY